MQGNHTKNTRPLFIFESGSYCQLLQVVQGKFWIHFFPINLNEMTLKINQLKLCASKGLGSQNLVPMYVNPIFLVSFVSSKHLIEEKKRKKKQLIDKYTKGDIMKNKIENFSISFNGRNPLNN